MGCSGFGAWESHILAPVAAQSLKNSRKRLHALLFPTKPNSGKPNHALPVGLFEPKLPAIACMDIGMQTLHDSA